MPNALDPCLIDTRYDSRSISFENPSGARGSGGVSGGGRKGNPSKIVPPGASIDLAVIRASGTIRHFWATVDHWSPKVLRALRLEIFYDDLEFPSVSVPLLDFFGQVHGRPCEHYSALLSSPEARGFNSYIPIPFQLAVRVSLTNDSKHHVRLFYQIDYTIEPAAMVPRSYLHVSFRRDNPTKMANDFVILDGLEGPGRFLGCCLGIRVLDSGTWYGEGEVKIFLDEDDPHPTICGTGLEDYIGTAWGLGCHFGLYAGAPLVLPDPGLEKPDNFKPDWVGLYRWHLPDPVMFASRIRVTIQQIGLAVFDDSQAVQFRKYTEQHPVTPKGWGRIGTTTFGLVERCDDYCATAFVYCTRPQAVPAYANGAAVADLDLLEFESGPDMPDERREAINRALLRQE